MLFFSSFVSDIVIAANEALAEGVRIFTNGEIILARFRLISLSLIQIRADIEIALYQWRGNHNLARDTQGGAQHCLEIASVCASLRTTSGRYLVGAHLNCGSGLGPINNGVHHVFVHRGGNRILASHVISNGDLPAGLH